MNIKYANRLTEAYGKIDEAHHYLDEDKREKESAKKDAVLNELIAVFGQDVRVDQALDKYRNRNFVHPGLIENTVEAQFKIMDGYRLLTPSQEKHIFRGMDKGYDMYLELRERNREPTSDEEQALINLVAGHQIAYHCNLRLVGSIAKRYFTKGTAGLGKEDILMEGNVGLSKAIRRFDIEKGFKFSTYATWWIQQNITRALADKQRTIRIPVHQNERWIKYLKQEEVLRKKLGRDPSTEELARTLEITSSEVKDIQDIGQVALASLNSVMSDGSNTELGEVIADEEAKERVEKELAQFSATKQLEELFKSLHFDERELIVLGLRYGFIPPSISLEARIVLEKAFSQKDTDAPFTYTEVGKVVHLARERVRHIENQAIKKAQYGADLLYRGKTA